MIRPFQDFLRPGSIGDPTKVLVARQSEDLNAPGFELIEGLDWTQFVDNEFEVDWFWEGTSTQDTSATNIFFLNNVTTSHGFDLLGKWPNELHLIVYPTTGGGRLEILPAALGPMLDGSRHACKTLFGVDGQIAHLVDNNVKGRLSTTKNLTTSLTDYFTIGDQPPGGTATELEDGTISGLKVYARIPKQGDLCTQHYQLDCDGVNFQSKKCPFTSTSPIIEWTGIGTGIETDGVLVGGRQAGGIDCYISGADFVVRNYYLNESVTIPKIDLLGAYTARVDYYGGNMRLFVNDLLAGSVAATWSPPTTEKIFIGSDDVGANVLNNHTIRNFRVYE